MLAIWQKQKVNKMNFAIDTGSDTSEGPWINWSARGTQDGTIPAKSFFLRDENGKTPLAAFDKGVVLDIYSMKTGYQRSEGVVGVAPDWKWNASVSQMMAQPEGEGWKKGFSISCAISKTETATWEQAGAAAWGAFAALVPQLSAGPEGQLPVVKLVDTVFHQFKRGSTVQPVLEVVKWIPRPDALKEGAQAGIAVDPAPAPQPAPTPAPAPVAEAVGDDEF
jgi:hypothetical protein